MKMQSIVMPKTLWGYHNLTSPEGVGFLKTVRVAVKSYCLVLQDLNGSLALTLLLRSNLIVSVKITCLIIYYSSITVTLTGYCVIIQQKK